LLHYPTNSSGEMPELVTLNGIPVWQTSGRTFPVVAGAEDPPDGANNDGGTSEHQTDQARTGDDGDDFDKDRALATIRKLRETEKQHRAQQRELEALRAEQKKREDAEKSEAERLQARIAELERERSDKERELQETRNLSAVERAAAKAGAADPQDVHRLIDATHFEHDEKGNVTNADKLVSDLLKSKPYLAGKPQRSESVPSTPRSNGTPGREDKVKEAEDKLFATGRYTPIG
jgi:hypothetical protein